jgi:gas vesicle protein
MIALEAECNQEEGSVLKKILMGVVVLALSCVMLSCSQTNEPTTPTIAAGPDNSEITTTTDSTGTKTETRVFRDNPRISKVVVTTRDGQRTVRVYSKTGEDRELKTEVGDVLAATGNALADAAGFVADKSETALDKTKEGAETVADKTKEGAETVADKTEDAAKKVASETKEGAKTVGKEVADKAEDVADKTKKGAKKTGKTIKKIVTP